MGTQSTRISYSAIDDATGKEVVGFEFRQGLMKEDAVKANESTLLPVLVEYLQAQQKNA